MINEKLSRSDPISVWIDDFINSKDPRFAGKTRKQRRQMALGAYFGYNKENFQESNMQDDTRVEMAEEPVVEATLEELEDMLEESLLNEVSYDTIKKHRRNLLNASNEHLEKAHAIDPDLKFGQHVLHRYRSEPEHPSNHPEALKHIQKSDALFGKYMKHDETMKKAERRGHAAHIAKMKDNPQHFDHKSTADHIQKTYYSGTGNRYLGDSVEMGNEFKSFQQFFAESQQLDEVSARTMTNFIKKSVSAEAEDEVKE